VVPAINEPVPGWIDNFNGPVGLFIGTGKGIIRVILSNPDTTMDYMPVDVAIKIMCAAAWEKGRSR
jgi:fatty acyl-CoA reductase